jgi:hypothetical protein
MLVYELSSADPAAAARSPPLQYMAMLNTLDGVRDETGAALTPWGRWTRQWVAEENRHGDLMNKYCWLRWGLGRRACLEPAGCHHQAGRSGCLEPRLHGRSCFTSACFVA